MTAPHQPATAKSITVRVDIFGVAVSPMPPKCSKRILIGEAVTPLYKSHTRRTFDAARPVIHGALHGAERTQKLR
jgi:hypothetical protein